MKFIILFKATASISPFLPSSRTDHIRFPHYASSSPEYTGRLIYHSSDNTAETADFGQRWLRTFAVKEDIQCSLEDDSFIMVSELKVQRMVVLLIGNLYPAVSSFELQP